MTSVKYIGLDVHNESISICVRKSVGKVVMESVIETKASTILQFIDGLRGDLRVTFEEGTWAAWLYDLLKPRVSGVEVGSSRVARTPFSRLRRKQPGDECASGKRRRACRPLRCGGDQAHHDGAEQDEQRGGEDGLGNH